MQRTGSKSLSETGLLREKCIKAARAQRLTLKHTRRRAPRELSIVPEKYDSLNVFFRQSLLSTFHHKEYILRGRRDGRVIRKEPPSLESVKTRFHFFYKKNKLSVENGRIFPKSFTPRLNFNKNDSEPWVYDINSILLFYSHNRNCYRAKLHNYRYRKQTKHTAWRIAARMNVSPVYYHQLTSAGHDLHARSPHLLDLTHPVHHRLLGPSPQNEPCFNIVLRTNRDEAAPAANETQETSFCYFTFPFLPD